jgi:abequosyltransferase
MHSTPSISVCIPAYGRPQEYTLLLNSLLQQQDMPEEIIVCENDSPEREQLREITSSFEPQFKLRNCKLMFVANAYNLGLDGNVRALIEYATADYIFYVGNDDYVLPNGILTARQFLARKSVLAASRTFLRFKDQPDSPIGISRVFVRDHWINKESSNAGIALRMGAFISGLIFDRKWAQSQSTNRYDGTLYYQIYLLLRAFSEGTIGYMSTATVAARVDNPPQFGHAESEKQDFSPGKYKPKERGKMWASILKIAAEVESETGVSMLAAIRHELTVKMSFHVFEMFAQASKPELRSLRSELETVDLFNHFIPRTLYWINYTFGGRSKHFYQLVRWLIQR